MTAVYYHPPRLSNHNDDINNNNDDNNESYFHPVDHTSTTTQQPSNIHNTQFATTHRQVNIDNDDDTSATHNNVNDHVDNNTTEPEERTCRICLLDDNQQDLISPCRCKGSMKYVHSTCLEQWRQTSTNRRSYFQCDQCLYKYNFQSRYLLTNILQNKLTLHIITILLFILLAIMSGFVLKLLDLLSGGAAITTIEQLKLEAEFELMSPAEQRKFILQHQHDDTLLQPHNWSFSEFFTIDIMHILYGLFGMGLTGFITLLVSIASGTGVWLNYFRFNSFRNNNNRNGIEIIVVVIIILLGLGKCVIGLYRFVERQAEKMLADAKYMVVNVQE